MIRAGDRIPAHELRISATSMPVWASALQDPNPIHVDPEAARAAGLGDRVINQGPANIGYLLNALSRHFPSASIETMEFRFLDNVRAGDIVRASGVISAVQTTATGVRASCILELHVEDCLVLSGDATFHIAAPG